MQSIEEKHFKELFEVFPDAVVLIDTTTKLPELFNQAAYTQLEYKKDEFKKLTISDYEALESPEETQQHIQNIIKNGRDDFETKHKTKYGKILDIKVTVVSHVIENKPYFLCTFRDITDQKKLQKTLDEQNRFKKILLENSPHALITTDNNGLITSFNKKAEEILGYKAEEVINKQTLMLFHDHAELKKRAATLEQELKKEVFGFEVFSARSDIGLDDEKEWTYIRKDGVKITVELSIAPLKNSEDAVIGYLGIASDITKKKALALVIERERDAVNFIIENTVGGYWDWDLKSNTEYLSPAFKKMFGYEDHEMPNVPESWMKIIFKEDLEATLKVFDLHVKSKGKIPFVGEVRYRHKNGSTVWVICSGKVVEWDEDGAPLRMLGSHVDITKQKNLEHSLKESEQRFSDVAEAFGEYIWELNEKGEYTFLTKPFEEMLGYSIEESLGKTPFSFMPTDEEARVREYFLNEVAANGVPFRGLIHKSLTKDGRTVWQKVNGLPMFDTSGNIVGYRGAALDITTEKKAKEELEVAREKAEKAKELFSELYKNMSSGVAIYEAFNNGEDFIFKNINEASQAMDGVNRSIIGQKITEVFPGVKEMGLFDVFQEVYKTGKAQHHPISFYDDGKLSVYRKNYVYKLSSGEIVSIYDDVTAQMQAQEALEVAKRKAENANEAKTQFLANMSHEIRTPMNAVIGLGDILSDMLDDPRQKEVLRKINSSAKMLLGVINDILDYSKIEAGKLELEHKQFRLEDVLSQLKVMFESKASQKGVELYFFPKGECAGLLLGDELRLTQTLTNLLSNAIKFTHKGNITLTIECLHKQEHEKATINFSVEDSGIGMSEEHLSKLFKPFSQADSSTTRKYGGTGLGLVISKNIINAMGAEIAVQSQVGVGTKFSFTLDFELAACAIDAQTSSSGSGKVLIVDDQEISREVLKSMLGRFGYAFDEASNGAEAIERIKTAENKKSPYDILLIDWNMPILNGVETIKKLQTMYEQKELTSKVPTVFMVSGYSKETIDLGSVTIDSFISKPVTQSALFDAIADAKGGKIRNISSGTVQTAPDLTGLTVLIVEDNAVNQEVVSLMLEKVGITYKIANNGQEGLEVFLANQDYFDLILMDLQMPVMGGYEATREIRKRNTTIPIVALTAAAMAEDKEKAFQTGMNGHIGKPIDKNELYNTISQLCGAKINNSDKTKQSFKAVLDKAHLSHILDSEDSANALLLKFKHQLQTGEFQNIIKAIKSNAPDAHKQVHTLKGVSGNIGAFELHEKLAFIDGKYKNNEKIENHEVQSLANALKNLLRALESVKETSTQTQTSNKLSREELDKLLVSVKGFLKEGELMDDDTIHVLHENLIGVIPHQELAKWKECVEEFEFDKALKIMKKWTV